MGLRQRLLKRWTARKPLCRKDILVVEGITIYESALALIVLTIGAILSVVIYLAENIVFYHFENSQTQFKSRKKKW